MSMSGIEIVETSIYQSFMYQRIGPSVVDNNCDLVLFISSDVDHRCHCDVILCAIMVL